MRIDLLIVGILLNSSTIYSKISWLTFRFPVMQSISQGLFLTPAEGPVAKVCEPGLAVEVSRNDLFTRLVTPIIYLP